MKESIDTLNGKTLDIIIIGGGITGATCAWEAVLKGYNVALFERDDFASHTSSQSSKIAHSGLRYLQHADFARLRESIRERNHLTRNAPHLVRAQEFLLPIYGHGIKGLETMSIYMKLFDLFSPDRRHFEDPALRIPGSKVVGKSKVMEMAPDTEQKGLTGGAIWYESQMHNTERLLYSYIQSAQSKGAHVFNYAKVEKLLHTNDRVTGVVVKDARSGNTIEVHAKMVINAAGPWMTKDLGLGDRLFTKTKIHGSKAFTLITRSLSKDFAISFYVKPMYQDEKAVLDKGSNVQFAIPWRGHSMVGSLHLACGDDPDKTTITEEELTLYLERINEGYPNANLKRSDIVYIQWGMVPAEKKGSAAPMKHYKIVDHQEEDAISGLLTVVGVKFTTSRDVAERVIKAVEKRISGKVTPSKSSQVSLWGGDIKYLNEFRKDALKSHPQYAPEVIERLVSNYGSRYQEILKIAEESKELQQLIPETNALKAEIVHACRNEQVYKLTDVLQRRTDIGSLMVPSDLTLQVCAEMMAENMGWDQERTAEEVEHAKQAYLWKNNSLG